MEAVLRKLKLQEIKLLLLVNTIGNGESEATVIDKITVRQIADALTLAAIGLVILEGLILAVFGGKYPRLYICDIMVIILGLQ